MGVSDGVNVGARTGAGGARIGAVGGGSKGVLGRPLDAAGGAPNMSQRSWSPTFESSGTADNGDGVPLDAPSRGGGASKGTSLGKGLLFNIASRASNSVKPLPPSSKLLELESGTESSRNSRSEVDSDADSEIASRVCSDSVGALENLLKNRETPDVVSAGGAGC